MGSSVLTIDMQNSGDFFAFIMVDKENLMAGYLLCKKITVAYKYMCNEKESEFVNLNDKRQLSLGVSRIWIESSIRKKGFGKYLLSVALDFCDRKYSKSEIAFSQPTSAGKHLFESFLKGESELFVFLET